LTLFSAKAGTVELFLNFELKQASSSDKIVFYKK